MNDRGQEDEEVAAVTHDEAEAQEDGTEAPEEGIGERGNKREIEPMTTVRQYLDVSFLVVAFTTIVATCGRTTSD